MTVSVNDLIVGPTLLANGVDTISLDYIFADESWLEVYKTGSEAALSLGVDYTVAGVGTASAVVTLTTPADGTDYYSVYLVVPLQRSSDLQLRGEFKTGPLNAELDRLWQAMQGVKALVTRAIAVGRTSPAVPPLVFDAAADTNGRAIMFNADSSELEPGPDATDIANAAANATAAAASAAAAAAAESSIIEDKGTWLTATAYDQSDVVQHDPGGGISSYIVPAGMGHTSGVFATDLAAGKWAIFAQAGASGAGSGDMLNANNLANLVNKATSRANLGVVSATTSAEGLVEKATAAELAAGANDKFPDCDEVKNELDTRFAAFAGGGWEPWDGGADPVVYDHAVDGSLLTIRMLPGSNMHVAGFDYEYHWALTGNTTNRIPHLEWHRAVSADLIDTPSLDIVSPTAMQAGTLLLLNPGKTSTAVKFGQLTTSRLPAVVAGASAANIQVGLHVNFDTPQACDYMNLELNAGLFISGFVKAYRRVSVM